MNLNDTPTANRLHIIILGACNSGKSSVVNFIASQQVSLVSDVRGTTTDPVRKAMELPGIGPVVFIDTAGFDDMSKLGADRISLTEKVLDEADIAILLTGEDESREAQWGNLLKSRNIPTVKVTNKIDQGRAVTPGSIGISATGNIGKNLLLDAISRAIPSEYGEPDLLRGLVKRGDNVLLVMPQDKQAPKGRLILPQVQTLRALLDKGCNAICTTPEEMAGALSSMRANPDLVITDSQIFATVHGQLPAGCRLTSFSVLMASFKGDIDYFAESARAIGLLRPGDKVLIAEACTHAPQTEDIGRVKIPALLSRRAGGELDINIVSGKDFPTDLSPYRLVIHCGGCMFNRRLVLNRVSDAKLQGVPMTNYGIAIAYLTGILDQIVY
jgi:[FeFe] hydrogenase H-cluster maturation GTPase HydF